VAIAKVPATTDAVRTRFMISSRTVLSVYVKFELSPSPEVPDQRIL
jgi:hypothetical protein